MRRFVREIQLTARLDHLQALGADTLVTSPPGYRLIVGADELDAAEFAASHLTGSQNIGLGGQFATWAGTLLEPDRKLVIIAEPGRESEAAVRLGRIGFDQMIGYLQDVHSLESRPELTTSTERLSPALAAARLSSLDAPLLVDVRTPHENETRRIEGSVSLPLSHLAERAKELPRDRSLIVHCAGGYRSSIAASLLQRLGFSQVSELAGGLAAWEAAGLPLAQVTA